MLHNSYSTLQKALNQRKNRIISSQRCILPYRMSLSHRCSLHPFLNVHYTETTWLCTSYLLQQQHFRVQLVGRDFVVLGIVRAHTKCFLPQTSWSGNNSTCGVAHLWLCECTKVNGRWPYDRCCVWLTVLQSMATPTTGRHRETVLSFPCGTLLMFCGDASEGDFAETFIRSSFPEPQKRESAWHIFFLIFSRVTS